MDNPFSGSMDNPFSGSMDNPFSVRQTFMEDWSNNFMICAHGQLSINNNNVDIFVNDRLNVFTFSPPGGICSLPPENLHILRNLLHFTNYKSNNFDEFVKNILYEEKKRFGYNFCGPEWIDSFAQERGFSPLKACGLQKRNIQNKIFSFNDPTNEYVESNFGVWDLKRNKNIMDEIRVEPLGTQNGQTFYYFSDIIKAINEINQ